MNRQNAIADFHARYEPIRQRADRLSRNIIAEARRTAKEAGLSPEMPFLHAHNAMCSQHYGNPWPEVNYSMARRVLWLEQKSYEPHRLADVIWKRMWNRMIEENGWSDARY